MRRVAPQELLARAARYENLTRYERAELGRGLRRLGWTYGEIRELIPVPKGTLAGWCRDIWLSTDQVAAIKARTNGRRGIPRGTQRKRRAEIERIEREARAFAQAHSKDTLFIGGTMLYWAEGSKGNAESCRWPTVIHVSFGTSFAGSVRSTMPRRSSL